MEETYQVTSALKFLPWGKSVAVVTDGRFSGVSTGACIGHVSPEALAGGPIGRLRDGDVVEIVDRPPRARGARGPRGHGRGAAHRRRGGAPPRVAPPAPRPRPAPRPARRHAPLGRLQEASGGIWAGCVYDPDRIAGAIEGT